MARRAAKTKRMAWAMAWHRANGMAMLSGESSRVAKSMKKYRRHRRRESNQAKKSVAKATESESGRHEHGEESGEATKKTSGKRNGLSA